MKKRKEKEVVSLKQSDGKEPIVVLDSNVAPVIFPKNAIAVLDPDTNQTILTTYEDNDIRPLPPPGARGPRYLFCTQDRVVRYIHPFHDDKEAKEEGVKIARRLCARARRADEKGDYRVGIYRASGKLATGHILYALAEVL